MEIAVLDVPRESSVDTLGAIVARIAEHHGLKRDIKPADSLVDSGMTSLAMVDLMLAIEAAFDVTIPQRDLTLGNFVSINSVAQMLGALRLCDDRSHRPTA